MPTDVETHAQPIGILAAFCSNPGASVRSQPNLLASEAVNTLTRRAAARKAQIRSGGASAPRVASTSSPALRSNQG